MPARKMLVVLINKVADMAMEIHRKNKVSYSLAVDEATREVENLTEEHRLELTKNVRAELSRRRKLVADVKLHNKKTRVGNSYHSGVMSSIRRSRNRIKAPRPPKFGNTSEERSRQKKLEQQKKDAEGVARERNDHLLQDP